MAKWYTMKTSLYTIYYVIWTGYDVIDSVKPVSFSPYQMPSTSCLWGLSDHCASHTVIIVFQVSIVAMQRGEHLMPFKTKSGDTLEILYLEELSAEVTEALFSVGLYFPFLFVLALDAFWNVVCRRFLQGSNSITVWKHGDSGLQDGLSCSSVFSWPCVSSTHWVNSTLTTTSSMDFIHFLACLTPWMFCVCSGLGSCSQRAGVHGAEDLRIMCLLLSVSSHHCSGLAFLSPISGSSTGSTGSTADASRPLRTSSQEKRMMIELMIAVFDAWLYPCFLLSSAAKCTGLACSK